MVQVQSTWFPVIDRNPADVRAEYLHGHRHRLPKGDSAHLPDAGIPLAHRPAGGALTVTKIAR